MKITHLVSTYSPYKGGMGNVAASFVRELRRKGHVVNVLTPQYDETESADGIFRIKPLFKYGNSAFVPKIRKHLKDVDIIHLHYPFFGGAETVARFKKKNPAIRLVVTYHMDVYGGGWLKWFFRIYNKIAFPWIIKKADVVVVSSMDYANHSRILAKGRPKRVVELPFGVAEKYCPGPDRQTSDRVRLLFVGGLDKAHYFKGLDNLIKALSMADATNYHLKVVGGGEMLAQYEKQVFELGLKDRIEFVGKLSDDDLVQAYQNADATILPSTDSSEAFGLVLIESMACGTPVIASNLPGVRSVVDDGVTGFLVAPDDVSVLSNAIESLLKDPDKLQSMRQASSDRVEHHYRWPVIIDKLEGIYKELRK